MWSRLSVLLFALAVQGSFPASSTQTLRQRYGQPLSETFLVRPGIAVTATYGANGDTCELVISPQEKEADAMIRRWPGSHEIDYKLLENIEEELIPTSERGGFTISTFHNDICLPENDCFGEDNDWTKVVIYSNAGKTGARYAVIQWHRQGCSHSP